MTPANRAILLAPPFNPLSLYRAGAGGEYSLLSDLSSIYQESTGITPGAVASAIGLLMDKRLGMVRGSEQAAATYATVSSSDNVTTPVSATSFSTTAGSTATRAYLNLTCAVGSFFEITYRVASVSGGTIALLFRNAAAGGGAGVTGSTGGVGTYTCRVGPSTSTTTSLVWYDSSLATSFEIDGISVKEIPGNHLVQATAGSRPILTAIGSYVGALFDGSASNLASTTGGGASTAAFLCIAFRTTVAGQAQTLWSDRTGNTGLKLEITAGNALTLSGGNGASINTVTGDAVSTNTDYVATASYEGGVLSVQLSAGLPVTGACTLSAGTAATTVGKDNGAASGYFKGYIYGRIYRKDAAVTSSDAAKAKRWLARKCAAAL